MLSRDDMFSDTIPYLELDHRGSIMGDLPKADLVTLENIFNKAPRQISADRRLACSGPIGSNFAPG